MATSAPTPEKHWRWLLALSAVTLLALALRWYYVSTAQVLNPVRGDATQYYAYAWNLANHGIFAKDAPGAALLSPDNYRDPGYPLFLALWMKMLGAGDAWYAAVLLCQALLGALTVTLATQLGKQWLPTGWAIASGLLMAVWPHSVTINGYLLTETLFGFLCALGLLLFARACLRGSIWWAAAAGLALGAATLTNAVLLPFGILLAGFLAWRKLAPRKICVALAVGALLLPGAWAIRNTQIPAPTAGNSSKDRALQNFAQGAWPNFHDAYRDSIFGDAITQAHARDTLHTVDEEYAALRDSPMDGAKTIMRRFGQHPWRYAAWYLLEKPQELWGWGVVIGQGDIYVYPTRNAPFQISPPWIALAAVCHALNPLLMLLALASLLAPWLRRHSVLGQGMQAGHTSLISVTCLLTFATLVYTTLQAEPRYSIPFRTFEMLLAVTTLCGITTWLQHKHASEQATVTPTT
ncbi:MULTISPECIES: glycosyltransferase family 39 protein [unclassified Rhodanobacter]|uniref:ArnT family glycosyltransferase n=1 Tax=unclassified Rhodanobacter TaxID=2621553 RepID=UPI001BDF4D48|nr:MULTISPECIES: glycosyltransferase family 39 protein [unclassified Rhodanobacter]MBT2143285.1 glycosyltransferase family 39 protein [Rhodanobacter sp. LX-99]MBT2147641.1 glycosyltransferase family 39 protein [Rhodanobacter sp. LX-100]